MLQRKIQTYIRDYLTQGSERILLIDGARQVGKTYIIRHEGRQLFPNFVEVNMEEDAVGHRLFAEVRTVSDFYLALSVVAGSRLGTKRDTLVFLDEIQRYGNLLTLLKFLRSDDRFTYIASGSLLGVALRLTSSIPLGSIDVQRVYPLDFEEFLWANGVGRAAIEAISDGLAQRKPLSEGLHGRLMDLFRKYLLVGGLPAAVSSFVTEFNIVKVRNIQQQIYDLYLVDASRYETAMGKLKIRRIYQMLPSNMMNRKKRIVAQDIEGIRGKRMETYQDEFEYLVASGIALEVRASSKPAYPLLQNAGKNLLKLYVSDVGILTALLYKQNIQPIMDDVRSINLGAVYETVVAQELAAHGHPLYYFDNKKMGEVDYLIDDAQSLSVCPIEVKSGRDYLIHHAISRLLAVEEYGIRKAYVLSNERRVWTEGGITYLPIYCVMFL